VSSLQIKSNEEKLHIFTDEDPEKIFEIQQRLGRGAYASVYKGRVYQTNENVAIKLLPRDDDDALREVEHLAGCNHPNIVHYYGTYVKNDYYWLCIEYCDVGSVHQIYQITDSGLYEDEIALICRETLQVSTI
jgi:serine/threonine protein kinase